MFFINSRNRKINDKLFSDSDKVGYMKKIDNKAFL